MICRDSSLLISAQLDGQISLQEQWQLEAHLDECPSCRRHAAELRCLREDLQTLERDLPSTEMAGDIVIALQQEARWQARAARRRADQLDMWRMRIFSQSVGTVVSLALFVFLVSAILKPIYRTVALASVVAEAAGYTDSYAINSEEVSKLRQALFPPGPRPVFDPRGALLGFSKSFSADDEFIVILKVDANGWASLKEVIEPPRDPSVLTNLSNALFKEVNFQPAARRGKYVKSDAVLMFSKVNIPG